MWSNLPFDLLANIFSYLSPDSLANAKSACRSWRATAETAAASAARRRHPPWFIALPTRSCGLSYYVHNPVGDKWHHFLFPLDHTIRPIATINGLILLKITTKTSLQLAICNPFTRQFKTLPTLNVARTNPAVGVVVEGNSAQKSSNFGYKIYVAGGMSEAASGGGAVYQHTVEMYDSSCGRNWNVVGPTPVEFAVRLTVWSPNESVHSNGILYWMTSARAYSVMGFEIATKRWKELSVPLADKLEFAALVPRDGKLAVVGCGGGGGGGDVCVWELGKDDVWCVVEKAPLELGSRLLGDKQNWGSVKCVGIDGAICLYRDLGSGIIVWREILDEGKWEWDWIDGCGSIGGREIRNFPIKGLLIRPNLGRSTFF